MNNFCVNLIIIFFVGLYGCKVKNGSSTKGDCLDPKGCVKEYENNNDSDEENSCDSESTAFGQLEFDASLGTNATDTYFAQSFRLSTAERLTSFSVRLKQGSDPSGMITMELREDCSGDPCDDAIETSDEVNMSEVTSVASGSVHTFKFSNETELAKNTTYWAVVVMPIGGQATEFLYLKVLSGDTYANGTLKYKNFDENTWHTNYSDYDAYLEVNVCE